ncbi:PREDICTED: cysteine dioxygenase type 1-like, partial [Priapulus caudatus]|uniref:Cysteine dioxygenase n=1 Tax=Priapulus caudatus TaxID=37621 RepID=A0ABM1E4V7_PRICU
MMANRKISFAKLTGKLPETLDELIAALRQVFEKNDVDVEVVEMLMNNYKSNPEWKKYANFDPHKYTRNLVDDGNGKYNLIMLCWSEGQGSSIHSHANSHCFLKVLEGNLMETLYDWPSEGHASSDEGGEHLQKKRIVTVMENQVAYINDSLGLHRIENPSHTDLACSLHLYCPPFDECFTFDERTAHKNTCKTT